MTALGRVHVLAGLRYEVLQQTTRSDLARVGDRRVAWTPRAGLLVDVTDNVALFASYSHSFLANPGFDEGGQALPPEKVEQVEAGLRLKLLDGRLTGNAALFRIEKENVAVVDPDDPDRLRAAGPQRSRGLEIDLSGELLPGWRVIGNVQRHHRR